MLALKRYVSDRRKSYKVSKNLSQNLVTDMNLDRINRIWTEKRTYAKFQGALIGSLVHAIRLH